MIVQGTFSKLLAPGLNDVFNRTVAELPPVWPTFFNTESMDRAFVEDYSWAGLEGPKKFGEGESIPLSDPRPGFLTRYVAEKYGNGYRITREAVDDNLYGGVLEALPQSLVRGARAHKERIAADIFNSGFTGTGGGDGQPLFSTAHPLFGSTGGVAANRFATARPLSHSAIKDALTAAAKNVDDTGVFNPIQMKYLVVPRDLEFDAKEILGTDKVPYSADNTTNVLTNSGLTLVVWDYLDNAGDASNWFLVADKSNTRLKYYERWPLQQVAQDIDWNQTMKYGIFEKYTFGFSDFQGTFGVAGA